MKYPEDYTNQILNGDCLEIMGQIPENSIDLTITSPPYDNARKYFGYTFNFESIAQQLFRITKQGGIIVWVVNDQTVNGSETGTSFKQALFFKEIGFNIHDTMIYEKSGCRYPEINRYYPIFEYMFIFSKGKPKTANLIKDRKNKWIGQKVARKSSIRTYDGKLIANSAYKNEPDRKIKEIGVRYNIWRYGVGGCGSSTKDTIAFKHPAIFPEELAKDHIISWSNENDIVLDPMCGSGTTCKMAKILNRQYTGIDISEEYCNIARQRIKNAI